MRSKCCCIMIFVFMLLSAFRVNASVDNIDVGAVFLYIDVNDPDLQKRRSELKKCIKKDVENDELKYALRSVLTNIPWIRKIFIFMPNEKVKFLKEQDQINDKIVYVNQEELVGVTGSCSTLEWNLWKLKSKDCSDHIIYFNDDYFVGQPMKKSDFFYEDEDGNTVPYIFFEKNRIKEIKKEDIKKILDKFNSKVSNKDMAKQNNNAFFLRIFNSRFILYDLFKCNNLKNSIHKHFMHNAIPINLSELKEIYDIIKNEYKYAEEALESKFKNRNSFVTADLYSFYNLNKNDRKINDKIKYEYFDMADENIIEKQDKYRYDLFCINTGGDRNYTTEERLKAKEIMNKLFPEKTEYEVDESE